MIIHPKETKEVILEVVPNQTGELVIEGITWELFDVVSCSYFFPTQCPNEEATDENTALRLKGKELMFHYNVEPENASLRIEIGKRIKSEFLYSEYADIDVTFTNPSKTHSITHVYAITSHPIFFGFTAKFFIDALGPGESTTKKLWV
jgi:hypothetical protein